MEQQEKKTYKVKTWWKKNKGKIGNEALKFGYCIGGFVLGSTVTKRVASRQHNVANNYLYDLGIIKLFDPETNAEIGVEEIGKVLDKIRHKK